MSFNLCLIDGSGEVLVFARVHRQPRMTLFTPSWEEPIWRGLKASPVGTTIAQLLGPEPLKQNVKNVASKPALKSRWLTSRWEKHDFK